MKKIIFICSVLFFTNPQFAYAAIIINEIAWMGTTNSQYEEWVELYNNGSDDVVLAGWKLVKSGGTNLFSLTGSIGAGEYYLVCRTTGSLPDPLNGTCDEQGPFGGSGLNNSNDQVILNDDTGVTIDSADGTGGWSAGDAASKQTMQKNGSDWITATATPGAENGSSSGGDHDNSGDTDEGDGDTTPEKKDFKEKIQIVKPDPVYSARMIVPDYGIAGVAMNMKADVTKDKILKTLRGRYEWSMGDGASFQFRKNEPISHIFEYPGDYTVVLAYYSNVFEEEPDTIHRKTITIAPSSIAIVGITDDGGIQLQNNSTKDVDLAGWMIQSAGLAFQFPNYTTISPGKILFVSGKTTGIPLLVPDIVLMNPERKIIARHSDSISRERGDYSEKHDQEAGGQSPPAQDWSTASELSNASKTPEKSFWNYKWYVAFILLAIIAMVAYLFVRLYASRKEIDEEADEADELDYDLL